MQLLFLMLLTGEPLQFCPKWRGRRGARPHAQWGGVGDLPEGRGGEWGASGGADAVPPPLCSPLLTCIFIAKVGRETPLRRLTVEECGVEWGAVE